MSDELIEALAELEKKEGEKFSLKDSRFSGRTVIRQMVEKMGVDSHFASEFYKFEKKMKYSHNYIPIGRDIDDKERIIKIPISSNGKPISFRMLIVGKSGIGKTALMRAIWNRAYLAGMRVAILNDSKPEMFSSIRPVQESFLDDSNSLLKNEKPRGFDVKSYYPKFFQNIGVFRTFTGHNLCQFSLNQISKTDFLTLMDVDEEKNIDMKNIIENTWDNVGKSIRNFDDFINEIKVSEGIKTMMRNSIINRITILRKNEVIGNELPFSFTDDILKNRIPILNLFGLTLIGKYIKYPHLYYALTMRSLRTAKQNGVIPFRAKLMFVIDELERFAPAEGNPLGKTETLTSVKFDRQYGISHLMATQEPFSVSSDILHCDYLLLPRSFDVNDAREIVKMALPGEYGESSIQTFGQDIANELGQLPNHGWMLIDTRKQKEILFKPLVPLSWHLEEGNDFRDFADELINVQNPVNEDTEENIGEETEEMEEDEDYE